MTPAIDTSVALTALKGGAMPLLTKTTDPAVAKATAQKFEAVFITQFLGQMFDGIKTDGMFGGGQGEEMFRSLMLDEYGKQFAAQGGFGLANAVQRELLRNQEVPAQ